MIGVFVFAFEFCFPLLRYVQTHFDLLGISSSSSFLGMWWSFAFIIVTGNFDQNEKKECNAGHFERYPPQSIETRSSQTTSELRG